MYSELMVADMSVKGARTWCGPIINRGRGIWFLRRRERYGGGRRDRAHIETGGTRPRLSRGRRRNGTTKAWRGREFDRRRYILFAPFRGGRFCRERGPSH